MMDGRELTRRARALTLVLVALIGWTMVLIIAIARGEL